MSDINTNTRLFDLVRFCRAGLHEEGLIDDKEYAWLCAEASMNKSPSGGSASARRLEDYDELKDRIKQLEQALESITKQVPAHDGGGFFCLRFDGEGNEIGVEYIDPMTIVSKIYSIAIEAIETKEAKP